MNSSKKAIVTGAAGLVLAASGAMPALAAANPPVSVGNIFSGTVETTSGGNFVVGRRQRKGGEVTLVAVDTDLSTVASRAGLAIPLEAVPAGANVIVSGTKKSDGSVLASKIIVRK